jgi:hypothetical protein
MLLANLDKFQQIIFSPMYDQLIGTDIRKLLLTYMRLRKLILSRICDRLIWKQIRKSFFHLFAVRYFRHYRKFCFTYVLSANLDKFRKTVFHLYAIS